MALSRKSKYFELKYIVECKWPNKPFYETIAAFDSQMIATNYKRDCIATIKGFEYRTMQRIGDRWEIID